MYRVVIFDFDGVLIDSEVAHFEVFRQWFNTTVRHELTLEEYLLCVGSNAARLLDVMNARHGWHLDADVFMQEAEEEMRRRTEHLPLLPGVARVMDEAEALGMQLALCTSSDAPKIRFHLERLGLAHRFAACVTGDQVERHKPDPLPYQTVLDRLNLRPEQAVAIEDSPNGMRSAMGAGITTLVATNAITEAFDFGGQPALQMEGLGAFSFIEWVQQTTEAGENHSVGSKGPV